MLDIGGTKIFTDMQGMSFLKLLDGKHKNIPCRNQAYYHYYEFPTPHHVHPHFGIRTQKYKLIHFYGDLNSWVLFDLSKDPHEVKNIYYDKSNVKTIAILKRQLKVSMIQYKDDDALKLMN